MQLFTQIQTHSNCFVKSLAWIRQISQIWWPFALTLESFTQAQKYFTCDKFHVWHVIKVMIWHCPLNSHWKLLECSAQPCPFLSTLCRRFARWTETSTYSVTFDTSTLLTSLDTTLSGKGSPEVPSFTIMGQIGEQKIWIFHFAYTWYLSILLWPLWFISALSFCIFD